MEDVCTSETYIFIFLYDFTNHRDFKGLKYGIQACEQVGFHRGRYVTM